MSNGDEPAEVWARVKALREEGLDAAVALAQARQEYEIESAVDDLGLDLDGEDATGSCSLAEAVNWVADSIAKKRVKSSDAPSSTAWGLLRWAKSSSVTRAEFYKNIFVKILPTRQELENQARYSDDGSTQIELAERILARVEQQRVDDAVAEERRRQQYERKGAEDVRG